MSIPYRKLFEHYLHLILCVWPAWPVAPFFNRSFSILCYQIENSHHLSYSSVDAVFLICEVKLFMNSSNLRVINRFVPFVIFCGDLRTEILGRDYGSDLRLEGSSILFLLLSVDEAAPCNLCPFLRPSCDQPVQLVEDGDVTTSSYRFCALFFLFTLRALIISLY
jgi:hypothetical protein